MKKYLPYIFPTLAILIVIFLVFRWYRLNTQPQGDITQFGEGVEIENLSPQEVQEVMNSASDYETKDLNVVDQAASGQVRYEIKDGKVRFSIYAALPEISEGQYQVWLRDLSGQSMRKAFVLEATKSGFMGSAAISDEVLPFEIVVSYELRPDDEIEKIVLTKVMEKPIK